MTGITLLCVLIFFVFFAGVAMTVNEGLWSNAINVLMIIFCGILGVVLGPPLGLIGLEKLEKGDEHTWYFVFAGIWLVYFVAMLILRVLVDRASRTRMRFVPPLEKSAGPLMGLVVAVMFTSFFTFTIYANPVRAGEWPVEKGTWQETTMKQGSAPFYSILSAVAGKAVAESATK